MYQKEDLEGFLSESEGCDGVYPVNYRVNLKEAHWQNNTLRLKRWRTDLEKCK